MLLSLEHIVSLTHIVPLIGDVLKKKIIGLLGYSLKPNSLS